MKSSSIFNLHFLRIHSKNKYLLVLFTIVNNIQEQVITSLYNTQHDLVLVKKSLLHLPLLKEIEAAFLLVLALTGNLVSKLVKVKGSLYLLCRGKLLSSCLVCSLRPSTRLLKLVFITSIFWHVILLVVCITKS